jgi:hypothetical protein
MSRILAALVLLGGLMLAAPTAAGALPGDEPSTAIEASLGTTQYDSTNMTENAAVDPTTCGRFEDFTNTMWFSYTPTASAPTVVDEFSFVSPDGSTDFLAILFVFARHGSSLDLVACSAYPATVWFKAEAGTTYVIMSGGLGADDTGAPEFSDRGGTFDLTITTIHGRVWTNPFHASDTFIDEGLSSECGFDVTVSYDDRGVDRTFFTTTGARTSGFIHGSTTFSTDTGNSLTFSYAQQYQFSLERGYTAVGLSVKVLVNGEIVALDVGRITFAFDGSVSFEAGRHTFEGIDICATLAG